MGQLRERMIQAHGGRERWQSVDRLMASLAMGGTAFMTHFHLHALRDVEVSVTPHRGLVSLAPFPRVGQVGFFDGQHVWLETEEHDVLGSRAVPGSPGRALRFWSLWDELDRLYVVALTAWHAMTFPWLLAQDGIADEAAGSITLPSTGRSERLEVFFPAELPVPSPAQTLYADKTGVVRRMDFVPRAYGGWLRVGQVLSGFEAVNGLVLPTQQTLYHCLINNQLLRATRFLWLTLDDPMVAYRHN